MAAGCGGEEERCGDESSGAGDDATGVHAGVSKDPGKRSDCTCSELIREVEELQRRVRGTV